MWGNVISAQKVSTCLSENITGKTDLSKEASERRGKVRDLDSGILNWEVKQKAETEAWPSFSPLSEILLPG